MKQHNLWFFELEKQPIESFCKFVKNKVMNVSLEIKKIQKELELIQDENLINSIKSLLAFAKKQKTAAVLSPFTVDEYKKRAEQSEQDIKLGRFIDVDDL
jgi:hypothetical protein